MPLQFNDPEIQDQWEMFSQLDMEQAIFMSHYQLAVSLGGTSEEWKRFLQNPQVSTWLRTEIQMFKEYQLRQMLKNATDNEKSVGAAQMMNALQKAMQEGKAKEGPHIIYTHVPLTESQKKGTSTEVRELSENILAAIPEEWSDE